MEKGLISIIVPIYNTKEYLIRCVKSLQNQTYHHLEIILVDDGSTDGSGEICDKLASEDERIQVIHKENGGSSSARNLGIAQAGGEYIGFVDSDDYVDADMYEKLYYALEHFQVNAAQIGRDEIAPDGKVLPDICIPPEEPECIPPEKFMEELLMHRGDCSFCTKLIRKKIYEEWQGEEYFPLGVLNEDFFLLVKMLDKIGTIVSLPNHAYHVFYRVGSNSRKETKDTFSRVFADCVDNADMVQKIVEMQYPKLSEVAFRFGIFQRLEYMLHIPIGQMTSDNSRYCDIAAYLRKNWIRSMRNPVLTTKNKIYHTLFAVAPCGIRKIHKWMKG